jgi:hypothetical protein
MIATRPGARWVMHAAPEIRAAQPRLVPDQQLDRCLFLCGAAADPSAQPGRQVLEADLAHRFLR